MCATLRFPVLSVDRSTDLGSDNLGYLLQPPFVYILYNIA
jgi:hypothetical protein